MIELLVVLLIVTTVMALVGSLTIDRLEKTQAKSETLDLQNAIRVIGYRAFVTSEQHVLEFEGKAVSVFVKGQLYDKLLYEHLFFQPQTIVLNTMGFPIQSQLIMLAGEKDVRLDVVTLFSEIRDTNES